MVSHDLIIQKDNTKSSLVTPFFNIITLTECQLCDGEQYMNLDLSQYMKKPLEKVNTATQIFILLVLILMTCTWLNNGCNNIKLMNLRHTELFKCRAPP